jgi:hypothetical protein
VPNWRETTYVIHTYYSVQLERTKVYRHAAIKRLLYYMFVGDVSPPQEGSAKRLLTPEGRLADCNNTCAYRVCMAGCVV